MEGCGRTCTVWLSIVNLPRVSAGEKVSAAPLSIDGLSSRNAARCFPATLPCPNPVPVLREGLVWGGSQRPELPLLAVRNACRKEVIDYFF